jgi:hypothetical protein
MIKKIISPINSYAIGNQYSTFYNGIKIDVGTITVKGPDDKTKDVVFVIETT